MQRRTTRTRINKRIQKLHHHKKYKNHPKLLLLNQECFLRGAHQKKNWRSWREMKGEVRCLEHRSFKKLLTPFWDSSFLMPSSINKSPRNSNKQLRTRKLWVEKWRSWLSLLNKKSKYRSHQCLTQYRKRTRFKRSKQRLKSWRHSCRRKSSKTS